MRLAPRQLQLVPRSCCRCRCATHCRRTADHGHVLMAVCTVTLHCRHSRAALTLWRACGACRKSNAGVQARAFYGFQIAIENIHSEMYSLMIDNYVKDTAEKDKLFHAVDNIESVKRKADWACKWIGRRAATTSTSCIIYRCTVLAQGM